MLDIKKIKPRKTLNRALLRKVAAKLRRMRHPKHYDQTAFVTKNECGTACCIAGWTLLECGATPTALAVVSDEWQWSPEDDVHPLAKAAAKRLGIPHREFPVLFLEHPGMDWPVEFGRRWIAVADAEALGEKPVETRGQIAADLLDSVADGRIKINDDGTFA